MDKLISIVIPVYNSADTIKNCLDACLNQDYPKDKLEVIAVDDGSIDKTPEVIREYPVRYFREENSGPAKARNTGWKNAKGDIVCFTDADCVPDKNWVSKLVSAYDSDIIAGVGGCYGISNPKNLLACCIHQEIVDRHKHMPRFVNYLGSFNISYRKSVLEEVGGFDESYKEASGEDNDLAYRVIKKNYKLVFEKDAKVNHRYPEKILKYLKQQCHHGMWRVKVYKRHPDLVKGDVYSGLFDYIQPPIALAILILLPFTFKFVIIRYFLFIMVAIYTLFQILSAAFIVKDTSNIKYFALVPITFLRGFYRAIGMFQGFLRFFVFER